MSERGQSNDAYGGIDSREARLFRSLDLDNDQRVTLAAFEQVLRENGLDKDDLRLTESLQLLRAKAVFPDAQEALTRQTFCAGIRPNILLIERALQGDLVIPDFAAFSDEMVGIYQRTVSCRDGLAADYIPQLDLPEPELDSYGVSLCTVDGQRLSIGDAKSFFSIQSTCKPINYCLALEEHGEEAVHQYVGHEPSGVSFNELALDKLNRPHNPLVNAGAIMTASLIGLQARRELSSRRDVRGWAGTRFDKVMDCWRALCGGQRPRASLSTYLSERQTADRNFALGYYMREKQAFPPDSDLEDVLEFYFQCCAIELNTDLMSTVAATLANGGVCPTTGKRVFNADTIRRCLTLMSSCGMYDFSGEFAFSIGLPAKSGVSGAMMIVVPNVMGLCVWSPRLDEHGNSVRGIEFCRHFIERFSFHNFDSLSGVHNKIDPRVGRVARRAAQVSGVVWAASKGDLRALQQQAAQGVALDCADYDGRTPLHLAAAEGHSKVVEFLLAARQPGGDFLDRNPVDRWGGTPLDDAHSNHHDALIELLVAAGGVRGCRLQLQAPAAIKLQREIAGSNEMLWAASSGDLIHIRRLVARGVSLTAGDYDRRTPLHLAAAEGHAPVVRYLIDHGVESEPVDRWGHTPLDDARRHRRIAVIELLGGFVNGRKNTQLTNRAGSP